MLLIKPSPVTWADSDNLIANIHNLTLGGTINCCLVGIGRGEIRVGITADSQHLEDLLAPMLTEQLGNEPEDGEHWVEQFSLRRNRPTCVLNLQMPREPVGQHPPRGRDPLVSVYASLKQVAAHEAAGVSWVLQAQAGGGFKAHGVAFATGKSAAEVRDRASYVAAAYGALGFGHSRQPLFPKWAWRSVLAVKMRSPNYTVEQELISQVWHPQIAEDS